jgi:hypothetical protein
MDAHDVGMQPWVAKPAAIRSSDQGSVEAIAKVRLRLQRLVLLPKIPQLQPLDPARRLPTSRSKRTRAVRLTLCRPAGPRDQVPGAAGCRLKTRQDL